MSVKTLQFLSYAEYLASPRWQEIRKEALQRAGGRCAVCGARVGLEGHHRDYSTLGTPEEQEDVTVLCRECHELFSERIRGTP